MPGPRLGQEQDDLRGQARRGALPSERAGLGKRAGSGEVSPLPLVVGDGAGQDAEGEVAGEEAGEVLHDGLLEKI